MVSPLSTLKPRRIRCKLLRARLARIHVINRRSFLGLAASTALSAASPRLWGLGPMPMPPAKGEVEKKLDTFTADYMRVMNAPGMTQALTDTKTTIRTASYGFANVDLKTPVTPGSSLPDRIDYQIVCGADPAPVAG